MSYSNSAKIFLLSLILDESRCTGASCYVLISPLVITFELPKQSGESGRQFKTTNERKTKKAVKFLASDEVAFVKEI